MREFIILAKHLVLLLIAFSLFVPFVWMIGTSLKPSAEVNEFSIVPQSAQIDNYAVVLRLKEETRSGRLLDLNFPRWYFNSIFIASWVTFLQILTASMAAFAFSRLEWKGRDLVFLLYLVTLMIPSIVMILPLYQIMVSMGWVNTYKGLILPGAFTAYGTFLLRQFMLGIPKSYDEAAKIDGANYFQLYLEIILPMAKPGLITLAIFAFLGNFQSFFWPLVMVRDDSMRTIPIGLLSFQDDYGTQTELLMAATVMNVIPLIIIFIFLQKQLVKGIQLGGVKG